MSDVDMTYQVDGLRAGVGEHGSVADACGLIADGLRRHGVVAGMFGSVPAAARFHDVLVHLWDRQATDAGTEATRRRDVAERSGRAAGLGAALVLDSTTVARSVSGPMRV